MKKQTNNKCHPVGTIPKSAIKILEKGKIDTLNTHILDRSFYWLGTDTSIKSDGVKVVLWPKAPLLLSVMMRSYK